MSGPARITRRFSIPVLIVAWLLSPVCPQAADQSARAGATAATDKSPATLVAPAVVSRDAEGHVTVRATRILEPITVDGRLSEPVYATVLPIGDFVQQEPIEGAPASEKTEAWLLFDDRNIYVSVRCRDSQPDRQVANEMRRDGQAIGDNENFGVSLDTFHDGRNAFWFAVGLAGGLFDGYITDERDMNRDWNTVWDARAQKVDDGWTAEIVIPFKSLRYKAGVHQVWGVNFRRVVRWKNEYQFLTRIPAALGRRGNIRVSSSAILMGLEMPPARRTFEVKPYAVSELTTDRTVVPEVSNDMHADFGIDVKLGVTNTLTADFTYNTDFAQVEEDEQQINLTRFGTLFPEKRDFFLEGQGIFSFGGLQNLPRGGRAGGEGNPNQTNPSPNDIPILFFSRRIGLQDGRTIPIQTGVRMTGKAGPYSIGVLDIQADAVPSIAAAATNFSVARIKKDIFRRSAVGMLVTRRSVALNGQGSNQTFGVDGVFSFHENLNINAYIAKTHTGGLAGRDLSYRAQLDYNADRYGLQLEHLLVDDYFNPEAGFLRRTAFRRTSAFLRFSPRPRSMRLVRKFHYDAKLDYITDTAGRPESRQMQGTARLEFQQDIVEVQYVRNFEYLDAPFAISADRAAAPGLYHFGEVQLVYTFGPQRPISGTVELTRGDFYGGTRTGLNLSRGRLEVTPAISVEPILSINKIELPNDRVTTTLLGARASYAVSPRAATSTLIQYNSITRSLAGSFRFRWEYQPGSDFYVVYTDNRDTARSGRPELQNRGLIVKFTRLVRF